MSKATAFETSEIRRLADEDILRRARLVLSDHLACHRGCPRRDCRGGGACLEAASARRCASPGWTDDTESLVTLLLRFYRDLRASEPPPYGGEELRKAGREFDALINRHLKHHMDSRAARRRKGNRDKTDRDPTSRENASTASGPAPGSST